MAVVLKLRYHPKAPSTLSCDRNEVKLTWRDAELPPEFVLAVTLIICAVLPPASDGRR